LRFGRVLVLAVHPVRLRPAVLPNRKTNDFSVEELFIFAQVELSPAFFTPNFNFSAVSEQFFN